jgi:hypothetical protein
MLDFPASPSVGQKYPASPLAGIPTYTWDGEKWTTQGGSIVSASPGTLLPLMNAKPALVGVSTNFSREDHVHPVDTSRAPFDAMAYSGLQINGAMEISQELGAAGLPSLTNTTRYIVDGWQIATVGGQVIASSPNAACPSGFVQSLAVQVMTANAAPAAGNLCAIRHAIEGYRLAHLAWGTANAQPITISFWIYAVRPGNYSGAINNGAGNRSYPFAFTINAASTWEYKTVTIPGDTAGAWAKDNSVGLYLHIALMAGSTYAGPANAWAAANYYGVTGGTNGVAATTDLMLLTGVIVLPGSEAPSAARSPFVMRSYGQELAQCQRYWQLVYPEARWSATAGSVWMIYVHMLSVEMRGLPTIAQLAPGISGNASAFTLNALSGRELRVQLTSAAAGDCYCMQRTFSLDARL